jgi:hypothetical protein
MKRLILAVFIILFAVSAQAATNVTFGWDATSADCNTVKLYQSAVSGGYRFKACYNGNHIKCTRWCVVLGGDLFRYGK